jgi:hypothetical protein
VAPSSPSPSRDWLEGVVLRQEYSTLESEWMSKTGGGGGSQASGGSHVLELEQQIKSSSKSERGLDCVVPSD